MAALLFCLLTAYRFRLFGDLALPQLVERLAVDAQRRCRPRLEAL